MISRSTPSIGSGPTVASPAKTLLLQFERAYPIKYQREDDYVLLQEDMIDFGRRYRHADMSYGWAKLTCEYLARLAYESTG